MTKDFAINGRVIGPQHPPYVIAELSGNHNGEIERALKLINAAKAAGADAVKLQTYTADTITLDHDGPEFIIHGGPWDGRRLYDLYREAATPWEWHEALFAKARQQGLDCFSSPFDPTAVAFLETLDTPAYKIASFELVDTPLIRQVAKTSKPMILSTGMANVHEIEAALAAAEGVPTCLLHCVSGYPVPAREANLPRLRRLAERYDCPVGLSDHTLGTEVSVAAVALGACVIEKHLTLARADGGPDAGFSLEPDELVALVRGVRTAWEAVQPVEGLAQSEQGHLMFRRSLYVVKDMAAGDIFTPETVRSIRPGFGLAPDRLDEVLGRRACQPLARGTALTAEMIGD